MPTPRKEKSTEEDVPVRWEYDKIMPYAARSKPLLRPGPGIFDSPYVCLRINILWLPHIMGALDVLTAWDAWQGENDGLSARDEIEKLFAAMRDGGACVDIGVGTLLRQNPTNSCLLEQSLDGGDTWIPAFNFSLCNPNGATTNYNTYYNSQQTLNEYNQQWNENSTVNNFAPELVFDSTPNDADRDQAMCYAFDVLYEALIETKRQADEGHTISDITAVVIGALVTAVGGAITGGIAAPAIAGALATYGIKFGLLYNAQVNADLMEAAKADILCCFYSSIKGATPTEVGFKSALDDCGFEDESTEYVRAWVAGFLQDHNLFLSFLKLAAEGVSVAEAGFLPPCACNDWDYTWSLDDDQGDWYFPTTSIGVAGEWQTGVGIVGTYLIDSSPSCVKEFIAEIVAHPTAASQLTGWDFTYSLDLIPPLEGTGQDTLKLNGTNIWSLAPASLTEGDMLTYSVTDLAEDLEDGDILQFSLRCLRRFTTVANAGYVRVHSITAHGIGANPFEA